MLGRIVIKFAKNGGYEIFLKTGDGKVLLTNVTFQAKAGTGSGIESDRTKSPQEGYYEYEVKSAGRA